MLELVQKSMKKIISIIFILSLLSLIFTVVINADQNETVSLTVPPRVSDFQFNFASDGQTTVKQNTTLAYSITYGASSSAGMTTSPTIVVNYSNDTAPNRADVLDYVIGSASEAYGNTQPVVDLDRRTITWTIPNLPAGVTDQKLLFQLKTNGTYNDSIPFHFTLSAQMSNQYLTEPTQQIVQTYQFGLNRTSASTSVLPTATPVPSPSAPTPTPIPVAYVANISKPAISETQAVIQTKTTYPAKITVSYGTSPNALTNSATTNAYELISNTELKNLKPDTLYYFRITTENINGSTYTSEIFTLKTAEKSSVPNVENSIIVLSSNGNVFSSGSQQESDLKNPSIILTNDTDDTIAYTLTNPITVKTIAVIVTNKVLGANTFAPSNTQGEFIFPMQEKTPTLYVASLTAIPQGAYDVAVRMTDIHGNVIQKHISELKIMPRLIVYGADTNTPLSDARIYFSYYDEQTKSYQPVTSTLFGNIKNPSYTDTFGQSPITLPAGKYRIEESSLFYDPQARDFIIGPDVNQNFPILYLKRDPLNLSSLFMYTKDYFQDSWTKILIITIEFSSSVRIFHLVALEILTTFVCLTFFFFLFRSHLSFKRLPIFILFHLDFLVKKSVNRYIFGSITDEQNNPITRVLIEIEDAETKNIISDGSSHKSGKFYFMNSYAKPINLLFIKEGFEPTNITIDNQTSIPETGLHITMLKGTPHHETIVSAFLSGLEEGFGMLFEAFLISSFLLEILFSFFLNTQITLPFFFTLSLFNILLWLFYLHERRK